MQGWKNPPWIESVASVSGCSWFGWYNGWYKNILLIQLSIWDFITSNEFHLSIRNLAMSMIKMKKLIEKEKTFYEKNIANKENALLDMKDELSDLVLSFRKKVGDVLPENLLENKDGNQD